MTQDDVLQRLMVVFLDELEDHVETINQELLAVEQFSGAEQRERVDSLLRAAHSLKGAARAVGVGPVEQVCHGLEDILSAARDGRLELGAEWIEFVFAVVDVIEEAGRTLRRDSPLGGTAIARVLPQIERTASELPEIPPQLTGLPEAEEPLEDDSDAPAKADAPRGEPADQVVGGDEAEAPIDEASQAPAEPAAPLREPEADEEVGGPVEEDSVAEADEEVGGPVEEDSAEADEEVSGVALEASDADVPMASPARGAERDRGGRVRLASEKLDSLMDEVNQLRTTHRRVAQLAEQLDEVRARLFVSESDPASSAEQIQANLGQLVEDLHRETSSLGKQVEQVNEEVKRARMFPFHQACRGLMRTVRDIARRQNKAVDLVVEGGDVALDRAVLEGLKDPLTHLVQNAVHHGIERPQERSKKGKPEMGTITVSARPWGGEVEIRVQDDGVGVDWPRVRRKAGGPDASLPADRDEAAELTDLLFAPGFSTLDNANEVAGRGVGLDVVRSRIEGLRGRVRFEQSPQGGACFVLAVPLTLMMLRVLLVRIGDQVFAIPDGVVERLFHGSAAQIRTVDRRAVVPYDDALVPVVSLSELLGRGSLEVNRKRVPMVVVSLGTHRAAVAVDGLVDEAEVMVKSLGERLRGLSHLNGGATLAGGDIALILNLDPLLRRALRSPAGTGLGRPIDDEEKSRVLVVDDSVTTRTLHKSVLEGAGYRVDVAVDGRQAWDYLKSHEVDAVVSDIEMPGMTGYELTRRIRQADTLHTLPVILVTALLREEEREDGMRAGADAYLIKSHLDSTELLETLTQLV